MKKKTFLEQITLKEIVFEALPFGCIFTSIFLTFMGVTMLTWELIEGLGIPSTTTQVIWAIMWFIASLKITRILYVKMD